MLIYRKSIVTRLLSFVALLCLHFECLVCTYISLQSYAINSLELMIDGKLHVCTGRCVLYVTQMASREGVGRQAHRLTGSRAWGTLS